MGVRDLAKAIEMLGRAPRGVGAARTLRDATGGQVGPRERSRLARLLAEEGTTFTPAARLAVAQLIEATHHEIARTLHLCDELPDVTFTVAGDYRTTDLEEPSAIALLPDGFLLLVDDESGLHEARRPKAAETEVRTQAVAGGAFANAEGLAFDPTSGSVFTLIEDGSLWRQTIRRAGAGVELGPTVNAGSLPKLGDEKSGWEGLCILAASVSPDERGHLLAVHEKNPCMLGIFARESLAAEALIEVPSAVEGERIRDLSDVTFDPRTGSVLLLSDESRAIFEFGLAGDMHRVPSKVRFRSRTPLPPLVESKRLQPEGIDFDADGNLWIACDAGRRVLYLERGAYAAGSE